jgi:diacylglycerol kinase (ATP)
MHNKPDFHLLKNIGYALAGMRFTFAQEKSFRTQVLVIVLIGIGLLFAPLSGVSKWILFASTWLVLIAEAFNSAIERVVDLVTREHHPLAGQAKDIGAFGVLLAFCLTAMIWGIVLYGELFAP